MHKYEYTASQLSIGLYVFSWPMTSLNPCPPRNFPLVYMFSAGQSHLLIHIHETVENLGLWFDHIISSFQERVMSYKFKLWLINSILASNNILPCLCLMHLMHLANCNYCSASSVKPNCVHCACGAPDQITCGPAVNHLCYFLLSGIFSDVFWCRCCSSVFK